MLYSVTLDDLVFNDETSFWKSFGRRIRQMLIHTLGINSAGSIPPIESADQFGEAFLKTNDLFLLLEEENMNLPDKPFVIFIDEFDILLSSLYETVCSSFLTKLRGIKTSLIYTIYSVIGIGTYSILDLNQSERRFSPFNIRDSFSNPNFTKDQVKTLYNEFTKEYEIEIEDQVIEDIYVQSNGYVKQIR